MTREQKIEKIEQLKAEIREAYKQNNYSDEIVNKVNECTRLILEVVNEW